jgi:DNA mismatch repair protein MutL
MVIVDQQRAHQSVVWAVLTNMTVQQASSQQLLFPLDLFFQQPKWSLSKSWNLLLNTGFVFEDTSEDHVVISGTVNVTEWGSLVLEQLVICMNSRQ